MNSIQTNEQRERRIQSVLGRQNIVMDSNWYGSNQGYVLDVTTMNLIDDLLQSNCEMMFNGPSV